MSVTTNLLFLITQIMIAFAEISVQKCKLSDSNCLRASAQAAMPVFAAGMPEVGTEPLDVMQVDEIKVNLAGLNMALDNISIKGLKKATITKTDVDMAKKQVAVSWDTDILMKGHYKAAGRLLILPITGDGDATIKLKKLHVDMTIPFEIGKMSDGKDMMDLKSYKYKYDVKDGASFQLSNLFNGNKPLSEHRLYRSLYGRMVEVKWTNVGSGGPDHYDFCNMSKNTIHQTFGYILTQGEVMLKFMNENWKILSQEFGGPMLEKPNKKIYEAIKKYLRSQPLEEIVVYN